jgi:endonuclease/exonuclease/phosphatase (EEP) superfamily protein YafD
MDILYWLWVMAHSLAYGVLVALLLAVGLVVLLLKYGWGWRSLWGVGLAGVLTLALAALQGWVLPSQVPARTASSSLRVAHLNTLFYTSYNPAKLAFVANSQAEVISLQEVAPTLAAQLGRISGTYPYQQVSRDRLPMALLSLYPLTRVQAWGERAVLYHVARPAGQGGAFYVLQVHAQSPYAPKAVQERDAKLAELVAALPNLPRPLLMVGDFNTTPWDAALRPLQPYLGLAGGWQAWVPTFPSWVPLTPIDQLYASPHWPKAQAQRVRVAGSDHVGLVVDFQ